MMKRLFLGVAIAVLLSPLSTWAQATQTVRGQVCDVASGEPMIGVTITVAKRPDKSIPVDEGQDPFCKQKGMNVGYAFSVKYTINKRHTAHHFILEYLQMKTFQGQTFDLKTHGLVDKFTSLTFPNIAYRVEF